MVFGEFRVTYSSGRLLVLIIGISFSKQWHECSYNVWAESEIMDLGLLTIETSASERVVLGMYSLFNGHHQAIEDDDP
jgi:hypothetical protein